jgi:hypothetical protein
MWEQSVTCVQTLQNNSVNVRGIWISRQYVLVAISFLCSIWLYKSLINVIMFPPGCVCSS